MIRLRRRRGRYIDLEQAQAALALLPRKDRRKTKEAGR